jgi:hypothetical protein
MIGHVALGPLRAIAMLERSGVPAFLAGCRGFETRLPLRFPILTAGDTPTMAAAS